MLVGDGGSLLISSCRRFDLLFQPAWHLVFTDGDGKVAQWVKKIKKGVKVSSKIKYLNKN